MSQAVVDSSTTEDASSRIPEKQPSEPRHEYPGIPVTCDGAEAVERRQVVQRAIEAVGRHQWMAPWIAEMA